jgi:hypothetical protein
MSRKEIELGLHDVDSMRGDPNVDLIEPGFQFFLDLSDGCPVFWRIIRVPSLWYNGRRISNLIMRLFYLFVSCSPIGDAVVIQELKRVSRNLVNFSAQAADARAFC